MYLSSFFEESFANQRFTSEEKYCGENITSNLSPNAGGRPRPPITFHQANIYYICCLQVTILGPRGMPIHCAGSCLPSKSKGSGRKMSSNWLTITQVRVKQIFNKYVGYVGKQCSQESKLLHDGLINTPEGTGTFADSILEVHEYPV